MLDRHLVIASAILLAACSPGKSSSEEPVSAEPSSAAPPAADSPLAGDLRILGTEPFWAIDISKTTNSATYSRAGEADVALSYPKESKASDGAAVLASTSS